MSGKTSILADDIQNLIHTVRGVQVMMDIDLAVLYDVETKVINQAVKRNINRFPQSFCFQITKREMENLKSQIVTSSWGGRRTNPYVFTEQGVAMLSAILRSDTAIRISIKIMNAFVVMRRFISSNAQIFQRLDSLEIKQITTDQKIDKVLNAIESRDFHPKQGIFFNGQIFDAYRFVSDLLRTAKKLIIVIDNYIDDTVLAHLTKRNENVKVTILTREISRQLALDMRKFNDQFPEIEIKEFKNAHDRFIIIDHTIVYHFGASLKDLGKKWFAFSKMEIGAAEMLTRLGAITP